jgi:hypothetical protein
MSTKCGCPDCKRDGVPTTRNGWKARKNHHGNPYGSFRKPSKHGGGHKPQRNG